MTDNNQQELRRRYEAWSDDELLNALRCWPEYQPVAVSIMIEIVSKRTLSDQTKDEIQGIIQQRASTVPDQNSPRIRPSTLCIVKGVVGLAIGLPIALRAILLVFLTFHSRTLAEGGYGLGGAIALVILAVWILRWSFGQFLSIRLNNAIALLDGPDAATRGFAAAALVRFGWTPTDKVQQARLLVGTSKYMDAAHLGREGIQVLVETLELKYAPSDRILAALIGTRSPLAISLLVELLKKKTNVSSRKVAKALTRLTGKAFGTDHDAWSSWLRTSQK